MSLLSWQWRLSRQGVTRRDRRVQAHRTRRRWLSGLRKPNAIARDLLDDAVVALSAGVGQPGLQFGDEWDLPA